MMKNKNELINDVEVLLSPFFDEELVNEVVVELNKMGFFDQSCSTKYHDNYRGGLLKHSVEVAKNLLTLTYVNGLKWSREASPVVIGLFHDLCKFDAYIWDGEKYIYNSHQTGKGRHGLKSLALISENEVFKKLNFTEEEQVAILWHMGGWSVELKDKTLNMNADLKEYPLGLWAQQADLISTYQGTVPVDKNLLSERLVSRPFTADFLLS